MGKGNSELRRNAGEGAARAFQFFASKEGSRAGQQRG
jgi:hypothetical protein